MQINLNGMLAGLDFLWAVSAVLGNPFLPASFNGIEPWSGILYLGLLSTVLAYLLYSLAISASFEQAWQIIGGKGTLSLQMVLPAEQVILGTDIGMEAR